MWHFLNGIPQIGPLRVTNTTIVLTGPALFADGSVSAPSVSFANDPDSGFYRATAANGLTSLASNGAFQVDLGGGQIGMRSDYILGWYSVTTQGGTVDCQISRAAADVLTTPDRFVSTGPLAGIGYATGAGGAVVQGTSKATGVTSNTICGQITMHNAALNAGVEVSFVLTNSAIAATDVIIVNHSSAGTAGAYLVGVAAVGAGSCTITVANLSGSNLSEAIVLNFAVIKGVAA